MSSRKQREALNRAVTAARELDQSKAEFLEHEFETYELLREHLPIARTERGPMGVGANDPVWFLTRYDDIADVLREPADFSSQTSSYPVRPWIPQAIDPPMHTSYRRMMNPWFTVDAMSKLEPHLEQYATQLVDNMLAKDEFDFVADFADPFPTVIFCELAGFPAEDYEQIMSWKNTLMHPSDGHPRGRELAHEKARQLGIALDGDANVGEALMQVRANVGVEIYAYLAEQIEAHRKQPGDDLITQLLEARFEGDRPLTDEELQDTLFLMFMAGLDTVASVLGLVVKTFAEQPDKRGEFVALLDDSRAVADAVEELVRFHAIVTPPRRVTRDLVFQGASFRESDTVSCATPSANRDPEAFEQPNELVFDRSPNRHMGFGLGPHRCLGIHLARRELRIGLQVFHRRLPDYELHPERRPILFGGMKGAASLWLVRK
jgi:cytochrome P450